MGSGSSREELPSDESLKLQLVKDIGTGSVEIPYASANDLRSEIPDLIQSGLLEVESATSSHAPEVAWRQSWMKGFWTAVIKYLKEQRCYENIPFLLKMEEVKRSYEEVESLLEPPKETPKETPDALSARIDKDKKWVSFKGKMKKIYDEYINDETVHGINVESRARDLFKIDDGFNFETFWAKKKEDRFNHFNPNERPWSTIEFNAIKHLATVIFTQFPPSRFAKEWQEDGSDTGYKAYLEDKNKDDQTALDLLKEEDGIRKYLIYKYSTEKGDKGWEIWKTKGYDEFRIFSLGGADAYESYKEEGMEGFKKWFLAQKKWEIDRDLKGKGAKAYEAWTKGPEYYKAFMQSPSDYESWYVGYEHGRSAKMVFLEAYGKCKRPDGSACDESGKDAFGRQAVTEWLRAYNACTKFGFGRKCSDEEKRNEADTALNTWYTEQGIDHAHKQYQNIMRSKAHPYLENKQYHLRHENGYSLIPYDGYHNHDDDLMVSTLAAAVVIGFIVLMIVCCVCWMLSALVGYYCVWIERKKRLRNQEEDEIAFVRQYV